MWAQQCNRCGVERLSSELQDGPPLAHPAFRVGHRVRHITSSEVNDAGGLRYRRDRWRAGRTSAAASLNRSAANLGNESTWGMSPNPTQTACLSPPLARRPLLVGETLSRGQTPIQAAAFTRAELSVRDAAVRVQYVDAWPQRRRAHGSARRKHTIDDCSEEIPGVSRFWIVAQTCESNAERRRERRRTPRLLRYAQVDIGLAHGTKRRYFAAPALSRAATTNW
jgi:hypothetical protein